jgi:hypothetical protein
MVAAGRRIPAGLAKGVSAGLAEASAALTGLGRAAAFPPPAAYGTAPARAMPAGGAPAHVVLEIHSGGTQLDEALVHIIRKAVRIKGGNVQSVLGWGAA